MTDYKKEYDSDRSIAEEFDPILSLADEHNLDEQVHDVKALDEEGVLHRYDDVTVATDQHTDEQMRAIAVEYQGIRKGIRLEYDHGTIVHEPFTLYVDGDDVWRDEVTAATDMMAEETSWKRLRDLMTL